MTGRGAGGWMQDLLNYGGEQSTNKETRPQQPQIQFEN